ncbi:hypothetical protein [Rhodoplanes roseus]|uniref:Uncharacterized protein n=1 Tax=Rhodoplanes roseus TaxID=29409 RepID=A0A327KZ31_9BRAD|nr:hypothetical protein [Rhodoplanes roseus]RAI42933.1 hypothetical protein CH341_17005 [Rhodoplanes roseus]
MAKRALAEPGVTGHVADHAGDRMPHRPALVGRKPEIGCEIDALDRMPGEAAEGMHAGLDGKRVRVGLTQGRREPRLAPARVDHGAQRDQREHRRHARRGARAAFGQLVSECPPERILDVHQAASRRL